MRSGGAVLVMVVALILAGCAVPQREGLRPSSVDAAAVDPVVVALLDSGAVPYIDAVQGGDDLVLLSVNAPFEMVEFSGGEPIPDLLERDEALWESLEFGRLYHFGGTRLLAISFDLDSPHPPTWDTVAHGIVTSALAARDAPAAVLVMVQVSPGRECFREARCLGGESMAVGMEWIADQDWIDVVSISMGTPANHPIPPGAEESTSRYLAASERAASEGKLIINGAGNSIVPPFAATQNGPPWIVAVGGVESGSHGEALLASKLIDVAANFTEFSFTSTHGEMGNVSGTSVATPIVAGTLAQAVHLVRTSHPGRVVYPHELRDALNASARPQLPGSWSPVPPPGQGLPSDPTSASLPILVQPQLGWGYVDAGLAPEIARRILAEDFSIPAGKDQARVFQPAWQQAREEFWSRYG